MKDPLEDTKINARRVVPYVGALLIVLLLWGIWSPRGIAVVGVILCLPLIIMLHEFAHFITAKRTGMKVTEFFVGFGPRLWSIKRGETEYGIKPFILGGYCKIVGMSNLEDVAPEDEARAYRAKPWHSKVIVASAGSMMHFTLAAILMFTVLWIGGDVVNPRATTQLSGVSNGAKAAGLRAGDTLVSVDGVPISNWDQVRGAVAGPRGAANQAGDKITVVFDRDGEQMSRAVALTSVAGANGPTLLAGVAPDVVVPRLGFFEAATRTPGEIGSLLHSGVNALGSTFSPSGMSDYFHTLAGTSKVDKNGDGKTGDTRFVSVAGIGRLSYDAVAAGWLAVMSLLISINVFVGLFNLVPLLPFDGGYIAIATYEKIMSMARRRKVQVDFAKLMPITVAVVAVLGFIFLSSLFLDISRPMANPF